MLLAVLLVLCVLRSCLGPEPGTQPAAGAALPPAQPPRPRPARVPLFESPFRRSKWADCAI